MKPIHRIAAPLLCALLVAGASRGVTAETSIPAAPRGGSLGPYQLEAVSTLLAGGGARAESLRVCVFRVSFADREFESVFDSIYFANELRHLAEYFEGASLGIFDLRWELMPGIVALGEPEAYYGEENLWKERMAEILKEVVRVRDDSVDFGRYDAVAVIHAGAGRETDFNGDSRYQLYSGFVNPEEMAQALPDTLGLPGIPTNDGAPGDTLFLDNLMVWPEQSSQDGYTFGSLGIYAYQVGLRLGMVPLFDTTPGDYPDSQGCGNFDLMGYGIYNALGFVPAFPSAFNRCLMGWAAPLVVSGDAALRLADVSTAIPADTGLVKIVVNSSEYYLVENRVHDADFSGDFDFIDSNFNGIPESGDTLRGAEFDFFITASSNPRPAPDSVVTGSGLLIWHVDETAIRTALEAGGFPNDDPRFKGVDLEEADGIQDLDRPGGEFSFGSFLDSYRAGNNDRFAADTDPSSHTNGGAPSGIEISAISGAGHYMTLSVRFALEIDYTRGEFAAGLGAATPIAAPVDGGTGDRMLIAADSGTLWLAEAGAEGWSGGAEEIVREPGAEWIASPVAGLWGASLDPAIFVVSRGGVLRAYDWSGAPVEIDDDATPMTIQLRGQERAALMIADGVDGMPGPLLIALSSSADSTYLCVLGCGGTWPGAGWVERGIDGIELPIAGGRLASVPAFAVMEEPSAGVALEGMCFAASGGAFIRFHFLQFSGPAGTGDMRTLTQITAAAPPGLLSIATGDIDGDGSDEVAAAIPGWGLCYCEYSGATHRAALRGGSPSSPILTDVDGDGTLETALRDEACLYLFSGFGVPVSGWPRAIDAGVAEAYRPVPVVPPVAGDITGDGRVEILFRVGGDIHALEFAGREMPGWPLPGEGAAGGSLALLESEAGDVYIVDCACVAPAGEISSGAVTSIRRYELGTSLSDLQLWPCYRHDSRGSGRQTASAGGNESGLAVDPASFIVYPNPVRGASFTVRLLISEPSRVAVTIFDLEGEKVASRDARHDWPSGSAVPFEAGFSAGELAGGVYVCRVEVVGDDGWSWKGARKFAVTR